MFRKDRIVREITRRIVREFLDLVDSGFLIQRVEGNTRKEGRVGNVLDLVFSVLLSQNLSSK